MAIGELASKVVITYKADTSDLKAKLKELQGEERKLAEAQLRQAEVRNKGIESEIQNLGRLTIGLELIKTAGVDIGKVFRDITGTTGQLAAAGFALAGPWGALAGVVAELAVEYTVLGESTDFADQALAKARAEAEANTKAFERFTKSIDDLVQRLQVLTRETTLFQRLGQVSAGLGGNISGVVGRVFGADAWSGPIRFQPRRGGPAGPERAQIGAVYSDLQFGGSVSSELGAAADARGINDWEFRDSTDAILRERLEAQYDANTRSWMDRLGGVDRSAGAGIRDAQESQLAKVFGPIQEFDAYATAFQTLSGAVGSAMSAWIDGSASAGEAFKQFVAEAVKSLAVQMSVEALKHGAYAIGSLAMGNFAGAAAHGKAAAGFAAGAIAAGVAARALGGGGAQTPGPGPALTRDSGGAGAGSGSAVTIVYGDSFAEDSPRNRQLRAQQIVQRAVGTTGVVYG